jgi:hypothetical protein
MIADPDAENGIQAGEPHVVDDEVAARTAGPAAL